MMTSANVLKSILVRTGKSYSDLARILGISKQNMSNKTSTDSFRFNDVVKILETFGYSIRIIDNEGNEIPRKNNSNSPRVIRIYDGILYDTAESESLCTTKKDDGDTTYTELFQAPDCTFFATHYRLKSGSHTITTVDSETARRMYRLYNGNGDS